MNFARLLFPAIRWDMERGFESARPAMDQALELGVGGFIIFGGTAEAVHALTAELQSRSAHPLLIAADLERGAGQQFEGATPLPPLAAIGSLEDLEATRRAGDLTAREARALGVNWIYAPDADVDLEPLNPIVGTRSFGTDPEQVGQQVAAWIHGCHQGGALACAKHFPGHGRTTTDSHAGLPRVDASVHELEEDLAPFRAAIEAGVDSIMSAHIAVPALDPSGAPATLSPTILTGVLRNALGFGGLIVTDAMVMTGVLGDGEASAVVRAVSAGCDALLYPGDLAAVVRALEAAPAAKLGPARVSEALARIDAAVQRVLAIPAHHGWGSAADLAWAAQLARSTMTVARGEPRLPGHDFDLLTIDDDLGGPYPPPSRDRFGDALQRSGCVVRSVDALSADRQAIIALYCDIRAWKGRPGCSARALEGVRTALSVRAAPVVLFGHPRLAAGLPAEHVLGAWGGEWLMQEAAARWLAESPS